MLSVTIWRVLTSGSQHVPWCFWIRGLAFAQGGVRLSPLTKWWLPYAVPKNLRQSCLQLYRIQFEGCLVRRHVIECRCQIVIFRGSNLSLVCWLWRDLICVLIWIWRVLLKFDRHLRLTGIEWRVQMIFWCLVLNLWILLFWCLVF